MKKVYSDKQINDMQFGISHYGVFGIVYREMIKYRKEPFGKDIDEFFNKVEKLKNGILDNPSPKVKQLYKDLINSYE